MNELPPIGGGSPALGRIAAQRAARVAEQAGNARQTSDVVELSTTARLLSRLGDVPEVRTELVDRVRNEIAAGTYETPEKIDATVDALLDELA